MKIIHRLRLIKHSVLETGLCFHHQLKPTLLGTIDKPSPCLQTTVVVQVKAYKLSSTIHTYTWNVR
jgi:hypothetical protein